MPDDIGGAIPDDMGGTMPDDQGAAIADDIGAAIADDIGAAMFGAAEAGIIPGMPPIIPIPAPMGKELTPHRQSHMHWPLFIVPIPGTTLALAIGIEELIVDMDEVIIVIEDVVVVLPMVSIARHAMSCELGALILKRIPAWQWSPWPQ